MTPKFKVGDIVEHISDPKYYGQIQKVNDKDYVMFLQSPHVVRYTRHHYVIDDNYKLKESTMQPTKFWMCYIEGQSSPTYRHVTQDSAKTEAERLSRTLGKKCYVLEAKSCVSCPQPYWIDLGTNDVPF